MAGTDSAPPADGAPASPQPPASRLTPKARNRLSIAATILAAIVLLLSSLSVWAQRQALETDRWTQISTELLDDPEVRRAVSVELVNALTDSAGAAERRENLNLPPALQPFAAQLSANLRARAVDIVDQVLQRPRVQKLWETVNRTAHEKLLAAVDENEGVSASGDVVLDLRPLLPLVASDLGLDKVPSEAAGVVVLIPKDRLDSIRVAVKTIRGLSVLFWIVVVALLTFAVWIAAGLRRRALMRIGAAAAIVGTLLLAGRRIAGEVIVSDLTDTEVARNAAAATWRIGTSLLLDQALGLITIGLLLIVAMWLGGPTRRATGLRRRLAPALRQSPAMVIGSSVVIALILLAVLPGSGRRFGATVILFGLIVAGIEVLRRQTLREFPPPGEPAESPPAAV